MKWWSKTLKSHAFTSLLESASYIYTYIIYMSISKRSNHLYLTFVCPQWRYKNHTNLSDGQKFHHSDCSVILEKTATKNFESLMSDRSLSKRAHDLLVMNHWFTNQFIIREFAAYLRTAKQMSSCQLFHAYSFLENVVVLSLHSRLIPA